MLLFGGGLGLLLALVLWVYCLIDVLTTEQSRCRNLPKLAWVFIVLLLAEIGAIAWLLGGKPWSRVAGGDPAGRGRAGFGAGSTGSTGLGDRFSAGQRDASQRHPSFGGAAGKSTGEPWQLAQSHHRPPPNPDDDPEFLATLAARAERQRRQAREQQRREQPGQPEQSGEQFSDRPEDQPGTEPESGTEPQPS